MKIRTFIVAALAALIGAAGAATAQTTKPSPHPKLLFGFDAQPVTSFAKLKAIGANAVHRFDKGPQKNVTLEQFLQACRDNGLRAIVQGKLVDEDPNGWSLVARFADVVIAIAHDDEPDINRYPATGTPEQKALADTWLYNPSNAPHPSSIGWTKSQVLVDRYAAWRSKTDLPITVNFAGNSINSTWYKPDLVYHKAYIGASDQQGADTYPRNNQGKAGHLYWPVNVIDKINAAGGKAVDLYVECSFQGRSTGVVPTPAEQSVYFWSGLGHGAKRIWFFPQQSDPPASFKYWNMPAENEAQATADIRLATKHMDLIADGVLSRAPLPAPNADAYKGAVVWPNVETFRWTRGTEVLTVKVDYAAATAPVITYEGAPQAPDAQGPTTVPTPDAKALQEVVKSLDAVNVDQKNVAVKVEAATGKVDELSRKVAALEEKLDKAIAAQRKPKTATLTIGGDE